MVFFVPLIFQSTRPVRGATQMASAIQETAPISIHAPRAGRDVICFSSVLCFLLFQSTRPVRGATDTKAAFAPSHEFQSTRPVRGATGFSGRPGSTSTFQSTRPVRGATYHPFHKLYYRRDFNPRAPCGARPVLYPDAEDYDFISIHAPRAGRDFL